MTEQRYSNEELKFTLPYGRHLTAPAIKGDNAKDFEHMKKLIHSVSTLPSVSSIRLQAEIPQRLPKVSFNAEVAEKQINK